MNESFMKDIYRQHRAQKRVLEDHYRKYEKLEAELKALPYDINDARDVLKGYEAILRDHDDDPFKEADHE
ncbi:hypothetical protein [Alkalicoccus chagannorensis]|uniref:hypothetical protein n=1 Tax=Alkalicoccus chagannorensis TaxID=427072 RepID=UPI0003F54811|nr:hypothetical protein [Alkalicoccus chagannorensis]